MGSLWLEYDPHYCRYFDKKPSTWTLQLSERYSKKIGAQGSLSLDGKAQRMSLSERQTITIPIGVGTHSVRLQSESEP